MELDWKEKAIIRKLYKEPQTLIVLGASNQRRIKNLENLGLCQRCTDRDMLGLWELTDEGRQLVKDR